jgi:hypothetical protein
MGRHSPFLVIDLHEVGDRCSAPGDRHFPFGLKQLIKM